MIIVLGDLLLDYSIRLHDLCIQPKDLQQVSYLELVPGGACNVAIMARHLGLDVHCMGEIGDDRFGKILLEGLGQEGIDTSHVIATPGARTPVATVMVDERGEPAYLGFQGTLQISTLPVAWKTPLRNAQALYSDGWIEHQHAADLILQAFRLARDAGVPVFFDPGPGNPNLDNQWHVEAASLATVLLATEEEAERLSNIEDRLSSARHLLQQGSEIVIVKRGAAGAFLMKDGELEIAPGFPVELRDATGAGDSFAGAILYGYLQGLSLAALGVLGNATGAAKVQKLGTGHNMPEKAEVQAVLQKFEIPATKIAL